MVSKNEIIKIYNKYKDQLYHYILKFTHNTETAEDILHDCFEKFISYTVNNQISSDKVKSFLYVTAHNLSVNFYKKYKKIMFVEIGDHHKTGDNVNEKYHEIVKEELQLKIYEILETVDPKLKSIFILNKEMQMGYEEIAIHFNISTRTVQRKIKQVIIVLMKHLKKGGYFENVNFLSHLVVLFVIYSIKQDK